MKLHCAAALHVNEPSILKQNSHKDKVTAKIRI